MGLKRGQLRVMPLSRRTKSRMFGKALQEIIALKMRQKRMNKSAPSGARTVPRIHEVPRRNGTLGGCKMSPHSAEQGIPEETFQLPLESPATLQVNSNRSPRFVILDCLELPGTAQLLLFP